MIVQCSKCDTWFEQHRLQNRVCKPCEAKYQREYMRKYRAARPGFEMDRFRKRLETEPGFLDKKRAMARRYWADLRHEAVMAYGGYRCACCGEIEPKFLTLDHIFNNGSEHRKEPGIGRGPGIFKWLRDHGYPSGFQILCMNCNHGKALNGGVCPHKTTGNADVGTPHQV